MPPARLLHVVTGLALLVALSAPALALAAPHEPMRHHLTLGYGFARHISDDFEDTGLETGGVGQFAYRYSLNPGWDLALDWRSVNTSDESVETGGGTPFEIDYEHRVAYFGPGVRWSSGSGSVRPYLQANVFFVTETLRVEIDGIGGDASEEDAGFGLMGGADIRLSQLLSIPLEVSYLYGKPDLDVSSLGMSVGLTFNFKPLPLY